MTLDDTRDFELIRDLIWEKSGIFFEETKRQFFSRRLQSRMNVLGCQRLEDYYRMLKYDAAEAEFSELLNLLTTTETYFFRNMPQLRSFAEEMLPEMLKRKTEAGQNYLHIWSAGCSSGEEPYTIAMLLLETLPNISRWKISIIGTDINTQVLEQAQLGLYSARSLRDTPEQYIAKYFTREGEQYRVCEQVRKMVTFRPANLVRAEDAALIPTVDGIFCRNVLIYFNVESWKKAINIFYDHLARQGYLLLGHSESLYRISAIFKLVKLQHSLVYYKE